MSGRFDFWGVGDMPAGYRPSAGAAEEFDSVDHFEFGASLHKALEITGSIHARTPKDADKMAESMKLIEAMLKGKPSSANGTKIDLDSANGTIKLSIVISEEDLKKGIEAQKSSLTTAMNSHKPPAKLVAPPQIVKDSHGDTVNVILPGGH